RERAELCRRLLADRVNRGDTVSVALDDPVGARASPRAARTPAATVRGVARHTIAQTACHVPVFARSTGHAVAGRFVAFSGSAIATSRGLRLIGEVRPGSAARTDWPRYLRARTGAVIDRDYGAQAPMVRALLIADQDGIAPRVRDTFADAGLVHMLSISGLHVAIIAGALLTLGGALRRSQRTTYAAAMVVIVLYVAMLGAPAPAVRSAVMLGVVGLCKTLQRPTHPWTALALGAVVPTVTPGVVLDLGWQLSVSGMAALVAARALLRRARFAERRSLRGRVRRVVRTLQQLRGWRYALVREGVTGTVATIVTAPIIAWTFGRVSVIAPLSNIIAAPLVAFIQPVLFLSMLLSPWPSVSGTVAAASEAPLALLARIAERAAQVPFATLHVAPTVAGALCAGVASAAMVRATAAKRWWPGVLVSLAALTLGVWLPMVAWQRGALELHVLDVGQGDALALRTPRGRWVLVDAGRRWDGGDAGRRTIVPYVRRLGGPVAGFVLTHAHEDHVGGAASIIDALRPGRWWEPAFVTTSEAYRHALAVLQRARTPWRRVTPGDRWVLDEVEIRVLAPDSAWTAQQRDANETSVVLRVSYGQVVFLLTGDAEREEEAWMLAHVDSADLRADVLKLGHHGSKTSSTDDFVDVVQPRVGLVSVGVANRYGHPSAVILEAFADRGIPLLRTDLEGTLVLSTDGVRLEAQVGRERWRVPVRARESRGSVR
ncbi:MAG: DNA internalization-related competence protein ComEC/Rec2, partial [Gemmatimonadaceae bacterium]|nr:DNA internalization-related competence protein ComEC/Rec2 [Gemmatimonadaceae bacterium]